MTLPITDADGRIDNVAAYAEGWPVELSARPLRLHTPQVEQGGLGGHCFSADFARYLAKIKPTLVITAENAVFYWWASDYGRERVRASFLRSFGETRGEMAYQVAAWLGSRERTYDDVMAETGYSAYKLRKFVSLAVIYAHRASMASMSRERLSA
jgi:hypothetical protein